MAGEMATVLRLCKICRTELGRLEVKQENMMLHAEDSVWCPRCKAFRPEVREVEGRPTAIEAERRTYPRPTPTGQA